MQRGQLESCVPKSSILGLKILWDIKRFLSWNAVFAHAMAATPLNLEFLLPEVKLRQMDPLLFWQSAWPWCMEPCGATQAPCGKHTLPGNCGILSLEHHRSQV